MKLIRRKPTRSKRRRPKASPAHVALVAERSGPREAPPLVPLLEAAGELGMRTLMICPPPGGEGSVISEVGAEEALRLGVRLRFCGLPEELPEELRREAARAESLTARARGLEVCITPGYYGGRAEIVAAVKSLAAEGVPPEKIDEAAISGRLAAPAACDLDLIVYAGDRPRFSDLLLWEMAYAEFYAAGRPWPELTAADLERAVESYASRSRRRGGVEPADTGP